MLRAIKFNDKRFRTKDDDNVFSEITNNCITLCPDYKSMDSLADEIVKTVNGSAEYNDYDCDDEDVGKAKYTLRFGLQRVIDINEQKITLALEPAIIYKAKDVKDIWFFDWHGSNEIPNHPYEELIYPMCVFKGHKDVWNAGLDEVYKTICNGRYGVYDGRWVNLHGEKHYDIEAHNCV